VPPTALTNGEIILIVVFVAIPIALATFAMGARRSLEGIGKGQFGIDREFPRGGGASAPVSKEAREAEVRQMLEAKAYRQSARGETPLDVDAELERLLAEPAPGGRLGADPGLVEEVRQLVVARNERRARKGQEPLDVEAEVERQLRDLENLGQ
jgi:hypothetical protein